jgi:2-hydroxy-3-keto-5-methylthiopentenyl-1-phosphate phosphatase
MGCSMNSPNPDRPQDRIVFCDFDGTITIQETFVAILKQYAPLAKEMIPQIYDLKLTLREGVRQMLESIPTTAYPEILEFAKTQPLQAGLKEFLVFLQQQKIPCIIISGGLKGMVEMALSDLKSYITAIYSVEVETTGDRFQVFSPAEGETDFVDKVALMQRHPCHESIVIGDSVTDLNMALAGDVVFARDRLAQYLEERKVRYYSWETFHDIYSVLKETCQKS